MLLKSDLLCFHQGLSKPGCQSEALQMPSGLVLMPQLHGERQKPLFIKPEGVPVFHRASPGAPEHQ